MWLIPICHVSHWWRIKINWVNESVHILDSFSSHGSDTMEVLTFAQNIVAKIHEVLERPYFPWSDFLLDSVSPMSCEYLLHSMSMVSVSNGKLMDMIADHILPTTLHAWQTQGSLKN